MSFSRIGNLVLRIAFCRMASCWFCRTQQLAARSSLLENSCTCLFSPLDNSVTTWLDFPHHWGGGICWCVIQYRNRVDATYLSISYLQHSRGPQNAQQEILNEMVEMRSPSWFIHSPVALENLIRSRLWTIHYIRFRHFHCKRLIVPYAFIFLSYTARAVLIPLWTCEVTSLN